MTEFKDIPKMMTIREVAKTGILPEHMLRMMVKRGEIPCIIIGERKKVLINFNALVERLQQLQGA